MCLFPSFGDFFVSLAEPLHHFSEIVWVLNICQLIYFILELSCLRKVKWCELSHAYLMVILSMISSVISSTFFLFSQTATFKLFSASNKSNTNYIQHICQFGPIIAISFRTMSKTFTWGFAIVRGQMVMESISSKFLSKLAKKAPYILALQCILITGLIIPFTETEFSENYGDESGPQCSVKYPLWLLFGSMLVGELFYGLGFMYIFWKAMSDSMEHVYKSMRKIDADATKSQMRHHLVIYTMQLFTSLCFLLFVASCICFQTLVFFEAELFISNLFLMLLFRHKVKLWRKAVSSCCCSEYVLSVRKIPQCYDNTNIYVTHNIKFSEQRMIEYLGRGRSPKCNHPHYSQRQMSFRNLRNASTRFVAQYSEHSNYFLSNKWRSDKEVVNIKHAIAAHTAPTKASKALELMGVGKKKMWIHHHLDQMKDIGIIVRMKHHQMYHNWHRFLPQSL